MSREESGYILVVEDEPLILMMVSDFFREAGFNVIEAPNADEALQVLQSGAAVNLVFSDVRMPGSMDGLALLAHSQEAYPSLPFLIASGHCHAEDVLAKGEKHFLEKPFYFSHALALVKLELAKLG